MALFWELRIVFLEELHHIRKFTIIPTQTFSFEEILEAGLVKDLVAVVLFKEGLFIKFTALAISLRLDAKVHELSDLAGATIKILLFVNFRVNYALGSWEPQIA